MSRKPISHSSDLRKLRDEGYDLEIRHGYLLVKDIPYVNSEKQIKSGILVSELMLAGNLAQPPSTHVAMFVGEHPCHKDGTKIEQIANPSAPNRLSDDLVADFTFSAKPKPTGRYNDYYEKVTTYIAIISGPAEALDPTATARTSPVVVPEQDESVFNYEETASSRAGVTALTQKLEIGKLAIVGLGGTGSYVLDLVAKTPVREIHLFDGDDFLTHNAFRSPGAPSIGELNAKPKKVNFLQVQYSRMHRNIIPHPYRLEASNVDQLRGIDFVFLCVDDGPSKQVIVEKLEELDIPFVDAGMGVYRRDEGLGGILRVSTSTHEQRDHFRQRVSFADGGAENEYAKNIQIADLNALNAVLAVIKWKKILGFYLDFEREHFGTYTIDGNVLLNEDKI